MAPAFRIVVLLSLVLFGLATCAAASNGNKSSWRFVSVHGGQTSGKHKR